MAIEAIKKKYPIRDENGQPSTYPTFASQVFFDDGSVLEGKEFGGGTASDSEKLGGKAPEYYTNPRNLLDNSDFTNPVNQRGANSYTGGYSIDRWRTWASDTLAITGEGITVSGNLYQYLEPSTVKNAVHTFAAMKSDGTVLVYTANPHSDFSSSADGLGLGRNTSSGMVSCMLQSGVYVWAALYEGEYTADNLPPYVPKGYAAELAECLMYYYSYGNLRLLLLHNADGVDRGTFLFPTKMRIIPTLSYEITGDLDVQFTLEETTKQGFSCYANGVKGCVQIVNCIADADL